MLWEWHLSHCPFLGDAVGVALNSSLLPLHSCLDLGAELDRGLSCGGGKSVNDQPKQRSDFPKKTCRIAHGVDFVLTPVCPLARFTP